ncbi:MAG: hypothetical protein QOH26_1892 [Actinomycetota bacterium]|nr:hypothetical protein [Actinomycetota bacterium]
MEGVEERAAEIVERRPAGIAVTHSEFPDVYSLNFFRADPSRAPRSARELAGIAEEIQSVHGLRHRRVLVNDGSLGAALVPGFQELGWAIDRLVVMALRQPVLAPSAAPAVELAEERIAEARRRYYAWRTGPGSAGLTEKVVDQLIRARTVTAAKAVKVRNYAALADGQIASFCDLYSDGTVAQIEDVGTIEPFRKRGLSRAVVQKAVEVSLAEGHQLIFLVADAEDWPKDFYLRLGFEPLGDIYEFTLLPDSSARA